jgi:TRAP-type C4-dicarboxylate transport system permease small subunit
LTTLFRIHDAITDAGRMLAMLLIGCIALAFSYEVTARYLFNAPTSWANAFVAYFLCASIFLITPELTRRNAHVVINMLRDALKPAGQRRLDVAVRLVAGGMCLFAAWFCFGETIKQYTRGIETISAWPVPKWMVSVFVPYGFFSAGLYFLRQIAEDAPPPPEGLA